MTTLEKILSIVAAIGVIYGIYYRMKMFKLQREKDEREKREFNQKEAERAVKGIGVFTSRQKYREYILKKFRFISFRGLGVGGIQMELNDSYIKLRTKPFSVQTEYKTIQEYEDAIKNRYDDEEDDENEDKNENLGVDFSEIFSDVRNQRHKKNESIKILIAGHPGSGKTTLLKWVALQCYNPKNSIFNQLIPVFFPLKNIGENQDLIKSDLLTSTCLVLEHSGLQTDFIKNAFNENILLFLLDGLDEIADESLRRKTINWIENQNMEGNSVIVSSRFSGMNKTGLCFSEEYASYEILDYSMEDISNFLDNWYKKVETQKEDTPEQRQKAEAQTNELIETLEDRNYKSLRKLAVNPLLLVLVAIIHYQKGKLPRYRYKLYEECIEVLANTWLEVNRDKGLNTNYSECIYLLSIVAVSMMKNNSRRIDSKDIFGVMEQNGISREKQEIFFDDVVKKAGILIESEGSYEFLHLTFQEYLTAFYYSNSEKPLEIIKFADNSYWHEPIKLFVNIGNAHQFFKQIIQNLEKEFYWQNLRLWEVCLSKEITVTKTKEDIEKSFANKIITLLQQIPFSESEEPKLLSLSMNYTICKNIDKIKEQVTVLFHSAKHPYVKSISAFLLAKKVSSDINFKDELKSNLDIRNVKNPLEFLMKNDSACNVLFDSNGNVMDFIWYLNNIKFSNDYSISYKLAIDLLSIRSLSKIISTKNLKKLLNGNQKDEIMEWTSARSYSFTPYSRDCIGCTGYSHCPISHYLKSLRDVKNVLDKKSKEDFTIFQSKLEKWINLTIKHVSNLNDEKIIHYFPNTTKMDIQTIRQK